MPWMWCPSCVDVVEIKLHDVEWVWVNHSSFEKKGICPASNQYVFKGEWRIRKND